MTTKARPKRNPFIDLVEALEEEEQNKEQGQATPYTPTKLKVTAKKGRPREETWQDTFIDYFKEFFDLLVPDSPPPPVQDDVIEPYETKPPDMGVNEELMSAPVTDYDEAWKELWNPYPTDQNWTPGQSRAREEIFSRPEATDAQDFFNALHKRMVPVRGTGDKVVGVPRNANNQESMLYQYMDRHNLWPFSRDYNEEPGWSEVLAALKKPGRVEPLPSPEDMTEEQIENINKWLKNEWPRDKELPDYIKAWHLYRKYGPQDSAKKDKEKVWLNRQMSEGTMEVPDHIFNNWKLYSGDSPEILLNDIRTFKETGNLDHLLPTTNKVGDDSLPRYRPRKRQVQDWDLLAQPLETTADPSRYNMFERLYNNTIGRHNRNYRDRFRDDYPIRDEEGEIIQYQEGGSARTPHSGSFTLAQSHSDPFSLDGILDHGVPDDPDGAQPIHPEQFQGGRRAPPRVIGLDNVSPEVEAMIPRVLEFWEQWPASYDWGDPNYTPDPNNVRDPGQALRDRIEAEAKMWRDRADKIRKDAGWKPFANGAPGGTVEDQELYDAGFAAYKRDYQAFQDAKAILSARSKQDRGHLQAAPTAPPTRRSRQELEASRQEALQRGAIMRQQIEEAERQKQEQGEQRLSFQDGGLAAQGIGSVGGGAGGGGGGAFGLTPEEEAEIQQIMQGPPRPGLISEGMNELFGSVPQPSAGDPGPLPTDPPHGFMDVTGDYGTERVQILDPWLKDDEESNTFDWNPMSDPAIMTAVQFMGPGPKRIPGLQRKTTSSEKFSTDESFKQGGRNRLKVPQETGNIPAWRQELHPEFDAWLKIKQEGNPNKDLSIDYKMRSKPGRNKSLASISREIGRSRKKVRYIQQRRFEISKPANTKAKYDSLRKHPYYQRLLYEERQAYHELFDAMFEIRWLD